MDYTFKILNFYIVTLTSITFIPFLNVFIGIIFCNPNSPITRNFECYEQFYYIHLTVAILGIIILILFSIICGLLYIDTNITSNIPFASPPSKLGLFKLFIKAALVIYYTILFDSSFGKYFICGIFVMNTILLFLRCKSAPYYNNTVFNLTVSLEAILFWINLYGVICAIFSD